MKRTGVLIAMLLALAAWLGTAGTAAAYGPPPPPPPPGGGGQQNGGSGGFVHHAVHNCSLYANSTSFGAACISGGSATDTKTVKQLLKGDPTPTCWDDAISDADAKNLYGYAPNPDGRPYFLHSCITGLDVTSTPYYQPNLNLDQQVILLPVDPTDCKPKKPYTDAMVGKCRMILTQNQQQIVSFITAQPANIPPLLIATRPSATVRTNEDVAYVDLGQTDSVPAGSRSVSVQVGNVTLTATMHGDRIYPYGPDGISRSCVATDDPGANGTPSSDPQACWWRYPVSSAGQPNKVYDFRLATSWTVTYRFANGDTGTLATIDKYDDLQLPVDDVQTVVVR